MRLFRRKRGALVSGGLTETTRVLYGRPREKPSEEKLDEVRDACTRHPEVESVHLTQRFHPDLHENPTLVLGLSLNDASRASAIFQGIGDAVHPLRPGDDVLDFEILDSRPNEAWIPVYQRS